MSKYFNDMANEGHYGITVQQYLNNRSFISKDKVYVDFCSTNYLGLDYREELFTASNDFLRQWGTLTQWSRLEAECHIFSDLEKTIGTHIGYSKILLSHTISNGCTSTIPSVVGRSALLICDKFLHPVVITGCKLAGLKSARIVKFDVEDLNELETILKNNGSIQNKFIFTDGVHSLARYIAPINELQYLCEKYQSWLFIDDAHGFGVFGENPSTEHLWGNKGNGVIKYCNGNNKRTFYTSSFGKAFCTHTAFMAIPEEYENNVSHHSEQFIYSAPVSPSLIGMAQAALTINAQQGDAIRNDLRTKTSLFLTGLEQLGIKHQSINYHPSIHVICGNSERVKRWNTILLENGIFSGIRIFPLTPKNECGFRFAITASNTNQQIEHALTALAECTTV